MLCFIYEVFFLFLSFFLCFFFKCTSVCSKIPASQWSTCNLKTTQLIATDAGCAGFPAPTAWYALLFQPQDGEVVIMLSFFHNVFTIHTASMWPRRNGIFRFLHSAAHSQKIVLGDWKYNIPGAIQIAPGAPEGGRNALPASPQWLHRLCWCVCWTYFILWSQSAAPSNHCEQDNTANPSNCEIVFWNRYETLLRFLSHLEVFRHVIDLCLVICAALDCPQLCSPALMLKYSASPLVKVGSSLVSVFQDCCVSLGFQVQHMPRRNFLFVCLFLLQGLDCDEVFVFLLNVLLQ